MLIKVTLHRDYGPETLEIGLENEADPATKSEYLSEVAKLYERIDWAFEHYETHILPNIRPAVKNNAGKQRGQASGNAEPSLVTANCTGWYKESKGGKDYFKAKVDHPRWNKFGVNVWPEVLDALPFADELKNTGACALTGTVTIDTTGAAPKVVKFDADI